MLSLPARFPACFRPPSGGGPCAGRPRLAFAGLVALGALQLLLFRPAVDVAVALSRDGARCVLHQVLPMQLALLHFKRTLPEFHERYHTTKVWQVNPGAQPTGTTEAEFRARWPAVNGFRNRCGLAGDGHHRVLDRMVRQRELLWPARARNGSYCVGRACRKHFLTVVTSERGDEDYLLEWVDWHLAAGVDFVIVYVDTAGSQSSSDESVRSMLKGHIAAGLVEMRSWPSGGQGGAFRDTFKRDIGETWWLCRLDADAFLYSPLDGSVFDFLASTTGWGPEQYLVPRFDLGDSGHTARPGDFMGRAYSRTEAVSLVFQSILFGPAGQARRDDDGSPHIFNHTYRSCGGKALLRFGPLLLCPWKLWTLHYVGWPGSGAPRVTFVEGARSYARGAPGVEDAAELAGRVYAGAAVLLVACACSCVWVSCVWRRLLDLPPGARFLSVGSGDSMRTTVYGKVSCD